MHTVVVQQTAPGLYFPISPTVLSPTSILFLAWSASERAVSTEECCVELACALLLRSLGVKLLLSRYKMCSHSMMSVRAQELTTIRLPRARQLPLSNSSQRHCDFQRQRVAHSSGVDRLSIYCFEKPPLS